CNVPTTSLFGSLPKPIWLSLIWTNEKSFDSARLTSWPNTRAAGSPPFMVHNRPVPAHAMHFKNPRRSTPSTFEMFFNSSVIQAISCHGRDCETPQGFRIAGPFCKLDRCRVLTEQLR